MGIYERKASPGKTDWFYHDRFGMFIHFGIYAMAARHEWVKKRERMSEEHYDKYFKFFNPDLLDAREWARRAKEAGMKYAVLTAKHHDGFCLFDTKYTDYSVMNTPYKKDIVRQYVEAFRAEGLKVGLYYSLIDWHHPSFPIDWQHPRALDKDAKEQNEGRDVKKYAEYMRNQVSELLTNYGKIDIIWFDFSYHERPDFAPEWMVGKGKEEWEAEKLIKLIRTLQPDIIINNRTEIEQDIHTPEQYQPLQWLRDEKTGELLTWEACNTFSGSWGYFRDEQTWKSPEMLINLLINNVCIGGNLLMNVGPTSRGYFDDRAVKALGVYEKWMKYNSRSIYGCTMASKEFEAPRGCRLTQSDDKKRLYIHMIEYPFAYLEMNNLAGKIEYAQFLHDGSEITYNEGGVNFFSEGKVNNETMVAFKIPDVKPDVTVPVIEVYLK